MSSQPHKTTTPNPQPQTTGCLQVLLRLTWLAFGNMALVISAALIARRTAPILTDILFFFVVAALIVVRYVDITRCGGQTSDGEPATLAHWRRYTVLLIGISAAMWGLARLIAFRGWV